MSKTVKYSYANKKRTNFLIITIAVLFISALFIFLGFKLKNNVKDINLISKVGIIENVEISENNDYVISLNGDSEKYYVATNKISKDKLALGSNIELSYSKSIKLHRIYLLKINNEVVYDGVKTTDMEANIMLAISAALLVIGAPLLVFFLRMKKSVGEKEVSQAEAIAKTPRLLTFRKGTAIRKRIIKIASGAVLVETVLGVLVLVSIVNENTILFCIFGVMLLFASNAIIFCVNKINHNEKYYKFYVSEYMKYLSSGKTISDEESIWTPEGIKVSELYLKTEEEVNSLRMLGEEVFMEAANAMVVIPFEKANFYACASFRGGYEPCQIIISTELDPEYNINVEFAGELDPDSYSFFKANNIEVKGLDYIVNHMEEELKKNNPKSSNAEPVFVSYKDK